MSGEVWLWKSAMRRRACQDVSQPFWWLSYMIGIERTFRDHEEVIRNHGVLIQLRTT